MPVELVANCCSPLACTCFTRALQVSSVFLGPNLPNVLRFVVSLSSDRLTLVT